jgi:hypothetical protein
MRALAYLEWRYALHQAAAIWRAPLRLAIWLPYLISLVFLSAARILGSQHTSFGSVSLEPDRLTGIGGLYMGALGITIAMSAAGRVSGFRSTAEAVFFSNSGIRPLEMALWLQLRKLATSALRWAGALVYYFIIFFPRHATAFGAATAFVTALLAVALLMSVELPIFLLSRGTFNFGLRAFGWLVAIAGFGYAAIGFAGPRVWQPAIAFVRADPGGAVRSIQSGSTNALTLFCALLAIMLLAIAGLARDSLPELYAVSRRALAEIRRRQSATRQTRYDAVVSTPATRIPLGALSLAWKDWIGFRRGQGTFALFFGGCAFWALCGAAFAYASVAFDDIGPMVTLFGLSAIFVLLFAPQGAAAGLASDLGKPLFWLGSDGLRARLVAWTLGRSARGGIALALAPACAGIVLGKWQLVAAAMPVCACSYWSLQALGVALYSVFPNPVDGRGPMVFFRTLATLAYVFPAFVAGIVSAALGADALVSAFVACATLAAEGYGAIEFASSRFREKGAEMALVANAT